MIAELLNRPARLSAPLSRTIDLDGDYVRSMRSRGTWACFDDVQPVGLDPLRFELTTEPAQTRDGQIIPDSHAVIRTDTGAPLGTVGNRFENIQPGSELCPLVEALAQETGGKIAKVSVLDGGKDVLARVILPGEIAEPDGRSINLYSINLQASNVGKGALRIAGSVFRPWCRNQYHAFATGKADRGNQVACVSIRHTESGGSRVRQIRGIIDALRPSFERFQSDFSRLMARPVSFSERQTFYAHVLPVPTIAPGTAGEELRKLMDKRAKVVKTHREFENIVAQYETETAWGALNGVTRWAQHHSKVRGERADSEARAYANLAGGPAYELSVAAQDVALNMF